MGVMLHDLRNMYERLCNNFSVQRMYLLLEKMPLTSLHPPSFHRNDFSTCSTHFSFILVQSPKMFSLRSAHVDFMHAHAHAENLHEHAHVNKWRRSVSAVEEPHDLP